MDLESKYNENIKLLKKFQKNAKQKYEVKKSNDSIDNKDKNNYNYNKDRIFKIKNKENNIASLNMLNVNDLNSLYFNDKIKPLKSKNTEENYKKVPILELNNLK